ncbi:hypothetical protein [Campylobacter sp.]
MKGQEDSRYNEDYEGEDDGFYDDFSRGKSYNYDDDDYEYDDGSDEEDEY